MNRTLMAILRRHTKFGKQWDQFLPGVLWAYRNIPHVSTLEKPSFCCLVIFVPNRSCTADSRDLEGADLSDTVKSLYCPSSMPVYAVRYERSAEEVHRAVRQEDQDSSLAV